MTLTIVTHSLSGREAFLERCKESVAKALIPGVEHVIIPGNDKSYWELKYEAAQISDYVAFVDDDDTIAPWAIRETYKAILETQSAVAFTKEVYVDVNNNQLQTNYPFPKKTYDSIAKSPRTAHHFLIIKRDQIDPDCLKHILLFNEGGINIVGIEWFMTASAASGPMGAVYLPEIGYYWTRHKDQTINNSEIKRIFNANFKNMSEFLINTYKPTKDLVKIYKPSI